MSTLEANHAPADGLVAGMYWQQLIASDLKEEDEEEEKDKDGGWGWDDKKGEEEEEEGRRENPMKLGGNL